MPCRGRVCFLAAAGTPEQIITTLLESGVRWVQYRGKDLTKRELYFEALRLREITRKFEACLIVNDYADVALAVDAEGVHLGQEDLPLREARKLMGERIVGISTHSLKEALDAEQGGADYIGFGPVFRTATKDAGEPKGLDAVRKIKERLAVPVIAIGGITIDNVRSVFQAGCDGVAVQSGLLKGDTRENARIFLECSEIRTMS